uniref:Sperm associated antigen 8 n=1 Tax=Molossus molossus TaxID=27622 RepID=A0A7J8EG80_MOLMO|nr:sperm associated antigen 8 [Molossus molossus]
METFDSTEGSWSRSLPLQPSSEGQGSSSEPCPSSDIGPRSALAAATAAAVAATAAASTAKAAVLSVKTQTPCSERRLILDPSSSDSLLGKPCTGPNFTYKIGHERLAFKPDIYCVAQDPCTTNDLSSGPGPGSSSGPGPDSTSGPGPGSTSGPSPGFRYGPDPGPGFRSGPVPGSTSGPDPGSRYVSVPGSTAGPVPGSRYGPVPGSRTGPVPGSRYGPVPGSTAGPDSRYGPRATNHLDQVPSMQDGSESFYFRHGHQGLLTLQLQSPLPLSTTQKDSYQPPRNQYQPIRGKREAMLEMLLCHQICKEVQAEQEQTKKHFEVESVTHHDYQKELVQAGPPAPTKPHDYCKEQPETFWIQRAPQLPVCEGN